MKGHPRVISYLQRAVSHEFCAAQQYTLQAAMAESWGQRELAGKLRGDAREELEHAEAFIARMLQSGATPTAAQARTPRIGRTQAELLQFGLVTEMDAIRLYGEAGRFCQQIGDHDNHALFARILMDEEQHARDLEQSLQGLGAGRS